MILAALIAFGLLMFLAGFAACAICEAPFGYESDDGFHLVNAADWQANEGAKWADSISRTSAK